MAKIPTIRPPARGVLPLAMGFKNCVFVNPGEDVIAKYNWLKSASRDAQMGALSATNRRLLILSPPEYVVTSIWTLDTNYVDVMSLGSSKETRITSNSALEATMIQTCNDVRLSSFWVHISPGGQPTRGFVINIASGNNSASIYRFMHFENDGHGQYRESVWGQTDIHGTWEFCTAHSYAWRCGILSAVTGKKLAATMRFCVSGDYSFGGDADNEEITGSLYYCKGDKFSFGGCSHYGCKVSGYLEGCEAGGHSFAMGMEFSGVAINCAGGRNCFSAYHGYEGNAYGTFSGFARHCRTDGGNSFGMGHSSCKISGQIIDCQNGDYEVLGEGHAAILEGEDSTIENLAAKATLTIVLAGANNDVTFTAKRTGQKLGELIQIMYVEKSPKVSAGTVLVSLNPSTLKIEIKIYEESGVSTANQVPGWIDAAPVASKFISAEATEGDGTGTLLTTDFQELSGGVDALCLRGNHPKVPTACIDSPVTVREFYNGHTYTNKGATGVIEFDLPVALEGFKYTFVRADAGAGNDIYIDPQDAEKIIRIDNTQLAAGEQIRNVADDCGSITLECFNDGEWTVVAETGTWTEETP